MIWSLHYSAERQVLDEDNLAHCFVVAFKLLVTLIANYSSGKGSRFWSSQCSKSSARRSTRRRTRITPGNCRRSIQHGVCRTLTLILTKAGRRWRACVKPCQWPACQHGFQRRGASPPSRSGYRHDLIAAISPAPPSPVSSPPSQSLP